MKKYLTKLVMKYVKPVKCLRCGERLYRAKDRANGISAQCAKKSALHQAQQIAETEGNQYFFSIPNSTKISPMYQTLEACKADADKRVGARIWTGSVAAPIPVNMEDMAK